MCSIGKKNIWNKVVWAESDSVAEFADWMQFRYGDEWLEVEGRLHIQVNIQVKLEDFEWFKCCIYVYHVNECLRSLSMCL